MLKEEDTFEEYPLPVPCGVQPGSSSRCFGCPRLRRPLALVGKGYWQPQDTVDAVSETSTCIRRRASSSQ
jgi:hypothetical protein